MAGRRGLRRGGRCSEYDVESSFEPTDTGISETPEEDLNLGFELGYGIRGDVGGYNDWEEQLEALWNEGWSGDGRALNRGGRSGAREASTARQVPYSGGGLAGGRASCVGGAPIERGRGGRRGASRATRGGSSMPELLPESNSQRDSRASPVAAASISLGRGQGCGRSILTSDQEESFPHRIARGGRSRGRVSTARGRGQQECLDGEGQKATKGKNFIAEEERQLARSVMSISQDPITGNGQKVFAYWERICDHYNEHRPFHYRPARSLESKWGLIKHDVAKFIGVLQQCTNLNVSGANAADVLKHALQLYRLKSAKNTEFQYLHVWEIVKDIPRWHIGSSPEKENAPGMKRKEAGHDSESTLPSSSTDDGPRKSTVSRARPRPQGSKSAKEERRLIAQRDIDSVAQTAATKEMAAATIKKSQIMDNTNLFLLMTHPKDDASISDSAARYLKLWQDEELEKLESRLMENRAKKAAEVDPSPPVTPIPLIRVETVDVLLRRVAEAIRPPDPPRRRKGVRAPTSELDDTVPHATLGGTERNVRARFGNDERVEVERLGDSPGGVTGGDHSQHWEHQPSSCTHQDSRRGSIGGPFPEEAFNFSRRLFFPEDAENHVPFEDLTEGTNPIGTTSCHEDEEYDEDEECGQENEQCIPESVFEDSQVEEDSSFALDLNA